MNRAALIEWQTLDAAAHPPGRVAAEALQELLAHSAPLRRVLQAAARSGRAPLIVVNDPQRSTQTRPVLEALARHAADPFPQLRFDLLVATGTHRIDPDARARHEAQQLRDTGLSVASITWHDARDDDQLVQVGHARLNHLLARSPGVIAVGSVEPHYFAGITGPHKTLTIGCLSLGDIERNHAGAMQPESRILHLHGNPVFDGMLAVLADLRRAGQDQVGVAEVLHRDVVVAAAIDDPEAALQAVLPTARRLYARTVAAPFDILHLEVPAPLGNTLYQADKALKNNSAAVRDGGAVLLQAACGEGCGPDAFLELLQGTESYDSACRTVLRRGYRLQDHKAVKLQHLLDPAARGVSVAVLAPGLRLPAAHPGLRAFDDRANALDWLAGRCAGRLQHGLRVEDAGNVTVAPTAG